MKTGSVHIAAIYQTGLQNGPKAEPTKPSNTFVLAVVSVWVCFLLRRRAKRIRKTGLGMATSNSLRYRLACFVVPRADGTDISRRVYGKAADETKRKMGKAT